MRPECTVAKNGRDVWELLRTPIRLRTRFTKMALVPRNDICERVQVSLGGIKEEEEEGRKVSWG